jgi:hypothetical protein
VKTASNRPASGTGRRIGRRVDLRLLKHQFGMRHEGEHVGEVEQEVQVAAADAAATRAMRIAMRTLTTSTARRLDVRLMSPSTLPIVKPALRTVRPLREEIVSPAEAHARRGAPTPQALYLQLLERPRGCASAGSPG